MMFTDDRTFLQQIMDLTNLLNYDIENDTVKEEIVIDDCASENVA